ncbi:MAG: general secretion pathway protein A [Proteobacteria bacterium]|nr:general secretion pathway protein A [Pseudomonadota bacterium]
MSTIISGDTRLPARFRQSDLVSLGSRIRVRNVVDPYDRGVMMDYLENALKQAWADHLMSAGLKETIVEHSSGNLRVLNNMAAELLSKAAREELPQLDESCF